MFETWLTTCKNCNAELITVNEAEDNDLHNDNLNTLCEEVIMEDDLEFEKPWLDEEVVEIAST